MPPMHLKPQGTSTPVEVSLEQTGTAHRYMAKVGSSRALVEIDLTAGGQGILRREGIVIPFRFARRKDGIEIWIKGRTHVVEAVNHRTRQASSGAPAPAGDIVAAMPGTILRIDVAAGDAFAAHQPLVIMESMKMEMTLSSPRAGRAREIRCTVGQLVDMGAVLITVDHSTGEDTP